MQSKASTVSQYLASLPADRRAAIEAVRKVVRANLDTDFEEGMQYGMIGYYVPHRVFPAGYHCDPKQPLPFVSLASQKNHLALYLMGLYCGVLGPDGDTEGARRFKAAWAKSGKKLDVGKSCVRFQKVDDLALDVIGDAIRAMPAKTYVALYEQGLAASGRGTKRAAMAKKASASTTPTTQKRAIVKKSAPSKSAATTKRAVAVKRKT